MEASKLSGLSRRLRQPWLGASPLCPPCQATSEAAPPCDTRSCPPSPLVVVGVEGRPDQSSPPLLLKSVAFATDGDDLAVV